MSLEFIEDDKIMLVALKNNYFVFWDVDNDELADEARWTLDPDLKETFDFRSPTISAISTHQNLIAVSYSRETRSRRDGPATTQKSTILSLTFSAAPGSNALVACYFDGELVLYDAFEGTVRHRIPWVNVHCMVSSPDGRTLATGNATGTIQLFDLETLKFLYRIDFDAEFFGVRALAITADSHRLLDVRGKQCRVWEPVALLRQEADDANSNAMSVSTDPQELGFEGPMNIIYITAAALVRGGEDVLCGSDDGSVKLYESARGEHRQLLAGHGAAISFLDYSGTDPISEQQLLESGLGVMFDAMMPSATTVRTAALQDTIFFVTTCEDARLNTHEPTEMQAWAVNRIASGTKSIKPVAWCKGLSMKIDHFIGSFAQRLVFLHVDGWVCSIPFEAFDAENMTRYFFVPADWLSLNNHLIISVTSSGDVGSAKRSELVFIKLGLKIERPTFGSRQSSTSTIGGLGRNSRQGSRATIHPLRLGSPIFFPLP
ncbi:hypothetical protein VTI74DRAFT_10640 [Chaetomium olivicolor]